MLRAGITLENQGQYELTGPILVGVRNISHLDVSLASYDGITPDGMCYYDITHLAFSAADNTLEPGELIRGLDLVFHNPERIQFTYEIVILAHVNQAPVFTSAPSQEIAPGNTYIYLPKATDPEQDVLRYELVGGPEGMILDSSTGRIEWQTAAEDAGYHPVTIRIYDPFELYDEQNFRIFVNDLKLNSPPVFTSTPLVDAFVGQIYTYDSNAADPDNDMLVYSLLDAVCRSNNTSIADLTPAHLFSVDSATGIVRWNPPASLIGETIRVTLKVDDGHGHSALQIYDVVVHADPVNH
ncbi:MAG: Ig domain-containing protein [Bacteroidales bacterium]|jgi:hypothetical protein|nr:Ig domain-containing protein [Bacteroidales bacterium]